MSDGSLQTQSSYVKTLVDTDVSLKSILETFYNHDHFTYAVDKIDILDGLNTQRACYIISLYAQFWQIRKTFALYNEKCDALRQYRSSGVDVDHLGEKDKERYQKYSSELKAHLDCANRGFANEEGKCSAQQIIDDIKSACEEINKSYLATFTQMTTAMQAAIENKLGHAVDPSLMAFLCCVSEEDLRAIKRKVRSKETFLSTRSQKYLKKYYQSYLIGVVTCLQTALSAGQMQSQDKKVASKKTSYKEHSQLIDTQVQNVMATDEAGQQRFAAMQKEAQQLLKVMNSSLEDIDNLKIKLEKLPQFIAEEANDGGDHDIHQPKMDDHPVDVPKSIDSSK